MLIGPAAERREDDDPRSTLCDGVEQGQLQIGLIFMDRVALDPDATGLQFGEQWRGQRVEIADGHVGKHPRLQKMASATVRCNT